MKKATGALVERFRNTVAPATLYTLSRWVPRVGDVLAVESGRGGWGVWSVAKAGHADGEAWVDLEVHSLSEKDRKDCRRFVSQLTGNWKLVKLARDEKLAPRPSVVGDLAIERLARCEAKLDETLALVKRLASQLS